MSGFSEFIQWLEDIPTRANDALEEAGLYMQGQTTRRLRDNKALGPELKKSTIERKGNTIKLVDTGRLMSSIQTDSGKNWVKIGTDVFYAEFHQFGTKKLPMRQFIYFTPQDAIVVLKILGKELMK